MVAEHIQRLLRAFHQIRAVAGALHKLLHASACLILFSFSKGNIIPAGGTGAYADTVRVVGPKPTKEQILISSVMCGSIALGKSRLFHHIGLVGKLRRVDGHSILLT